MTKNRTRKETATPRALIQTVGLRLSENGVADSWDTGREVDGVKGSAVLFLLTTCRDSIDGPDEPCLLLNKRSREVLQPGDLCCPGGGVEKKDKLLSHLLQWPSSPLQKWDQWRQWKTAYPQKTAKLSLLLATALREGWEEMRLNPLSVSFLGPLPVQRLVMFKRHIYPLVGWTAPRQHLKPNWEVERIVHVPLSQLVNPANYARYRLSFFNRGVETRRKEDFPCFVHRGRGGEEILWGATFRIVMDFLKLIYGFDFPDLSNSPIIERRLGEAYLNGSLAQTGGAGAAEQPEDY